MEHTRGLFYDILRATNLNLTEKILELKILLDEHSIIEFQLIPTSKRGQIHKYPFDPDNYEYEWISVYWEFQFALNCKKKKHTPTSNYWTNLKKYSDKSDRRYLENKLRLIELSKLPV